ncbi:GNAT family N-acetyltransferase [Alicyclobacillus fodiniaquatilis]|uniref:GNAT family N-acetyltransferase n=1 Tax=Alicyclobacillus fodiniaquatilis TaxID=1661150 RepID=A0ABW4JE43_9BACL
MTRGKIVIVALTQPLIAEASILLASYLYGVEYSDEQQTEAQQILKRFLHYQIATPFLARYDETYVGFIVLDWGFSTSKGLPVLRVQALYTLPAYREIGVASTLLSHAISLAKGKGANRLQLETDRENTPAKHLYAKFGFELLPEKEVYMLFL